MVIAESAQTDRQLKARGTSGKVHLLFVINPALYIFMCLDDMPSVCVGIDIGGIASQFAMQFCPGAMQLFLRLSRTAKHFLKRFSCRSTCMYKMCDRAAVVRRDIYVFQMHACALHHTLRYVHGSTCRMRRPTPDLYSKQ